MSAFTTRNVSPLDLSLDLKNPRFILPDQNATEADVIRYLLEHEQVKELCKGLNTVGTILPGERIVVCDEDGKQVVLEGNRRICSCKLLLDPSLIPSSYSIPDIRDETRSNISEIQVDVVSSRKAAIKYLAARHISAVNTWSTLAKMNYVNEEFEAGRTVEEIQEISTLQKAKINKFLKDWNLLRIGIENGTWKKEESEILSLNKIEDTDKYFRALGTKGTKGLQIFYDNKFIPHSFLLSDSDLYDVLSILVRGAFIDKVYDTRDDFYGETIQRLVKPVLDKYIKTNTDPINPDPDDTDSNDKDDESDSPDYHPGGSGSGFSPSDDSDPKPGSDDDEHTEPDSSKQSNGKPKPVKALPLFYNLDCGKIDKENPKYLGVIRIGGEIVKFSQQINPKNYSIAATLLTRCLLENVTKAYMQKKGEWDSFVSHHGGNDSKIQLSAIINHMVAGSGNYFPDADMRARFEQLFKDYNDTANKMNWVVHQLNAYLMTFDTLQAKLDEGLFEVIQFMVYQL